VTSLSRVLFVYRVEFDIWKLIANAGGRSFSEVPLDVVAALRSHSQSSHRCIEQQTRYYHVHSTNEKARFM
jgi:hypothetical protein